MRLSLSIALWLTVAVLIVLGAHGWIQLRQEAEDLDAAAQRQLSLVATAIRSAVENALRDHQEPDVAELLDQLEVNDPAVDVFVIGIDGAILGRSGGTESNLDDALVLIETQQPSSRVEKLDSGAFAVVTPLRVSGSTGARLVVIRPLKDLEADLRDERRAGFVSVGLLIAALLLLIGRGFRNLDWSKESPDRGRGHRNGTESHCESEVGCGTHRPAS